MISAFDRVKNIVRKRENAGYQHFLLFSKCFQESNLPGSLKLSGKGLILYHTILTFNDPYSARCLLKTLWEMEKMLVTSFFSFSHNVFYLSRNKFKFFSRNYFVVCIIMV